MILRLYSHPCGWRHWTPATVDEHDERVDDRPPVHECEHAGPVRLVGEHRVPDVDGWFE